MITVSRLFALIPWLVKLGNQPARLAMMQPLSEAMIAARLTLNGSIMGRQFHRRFRIRTAIALACVTGVVLVGIGLRGALEPR